MANLEKIMAETSKSYDASRKALNNQINAISGDLVAQQDRINAQYAQQGKSLDNQRNWQAQSSSMAASRNGGSFGGSSEIANKKYYQQAYVPAVTQMQTNQANDISAAESDANQRRLSLQQTLAQLNDEASRYAMQRYDAAREAEREDKYRQQQLALQKKQLAAQQAANNWMQYLNAPSTSNEPKLKNWSFGRGYSVQQMPDGTAAYYKNNGKTRISAGEFLSNTGTNWKKWDDIWQNGVSTTGVGSDTISAFHRMSINPNSNEYSYLFRS